MSDARIEAVAAMLVDERIESIFGREEAVGFARATAIELLAAADEVERGLADQLAAALEQVAEIHHGQHTSLSPRLASFRDCGFTACSVAAVALARGSSVRTQESAAK